MTRLLLLVGVFIFISGCAGLKVQCETDETWLGELYANEHIDTRNFEVFQNQCEKYSYRIPSAEKFHAAYNGVLEKNCVTARRYFITSYSAYRNKTTPNECPKSTPLASAAEGIRQDARAARDYRELLADLDKKEGTSSGGNVAPLMLHPVGAAVVLAGAAISIMSDQSREQTRKETIEKLKVVGSKYSYFISELN